MLAVLALPNADTLVAELRDGEGRTTARFGTHANMEVHRVVVDGAGKFGPDDLRARARPCGLGRPDCHRLDRPV